MEYLPNGELFDYVWKKQGLEEPEARRLFAQIVEGVQHCHKVGFETRTHYRYNYEQNCTLSQFWCKLTQHYLNISLSLSLSRIQ